MWKVIESPISKKETCEKMKFLLESLNEKIPGLINMEVGINTFEAENTFDVVFTGVFEDKTAYENYSKHEEHAKIVPFFKTIKLDRAIVDY
jgi:ABC-type molybdenum transport system ATPase subunit/photorepair protein PhrA